MTLMVQYPCCILRPGPTGTFLFCTAGLVAQASACALLFSSAIPKLNSKETLCPLSVQRTACPVFVYVLGWPPLPYSLHPQPSSHPLRNLPQIRTPARSTSTTVAVSWSTANPFRINI